MKAYKDSMTKKDIDVYSFAKERFSNHFTIYIDIQQD